MQVDGSDAAANNNAILNEIEVLSHDGLHAHNTAHLTGFTSLLSLSIPLYILRSR